ncbi:hypothetical protein RJ640_015523 [Escallonia rubra]|uniref:Uncharacterized protein n=1 Tax=Escallonia rubra TaxID=112253 RepID=A0AA88RHB5_9ASTE|nr:hypothetical protein RJ640_015523 [Escallonia rubra]
MPLVSPLVSPTSPNRTAENRSDLRLRPAVPASRNDPPMPPANPQSRGRESHADADATPAAASLLVVLELWELLANVTISAAEGSTMPSILNAMEVFSRIDVSKWPQGISAETRWAPKALDYRNRHASTRFWPVERVEETGLHLANYCTRFKVPFTFNAIANRWDTI